MSPVRSSVNERSAPARAAAPAVRARSARALGPAAAQQPVLGEHGQLQLGATKPSRSDAAAKRSEARAPAAPRRRPRPASSLSGDRGCRPRARPRRGAERRPPSGSPSARASRAPARPRPASAPPCRPTARAARSPGRSRSPTARSRAPLERSAPVMLVGLTYRWWASSSPNAAHTSLQWSLSAGASSSSAATTSSVARPDQVQQRAEALDRQQLGDVRGSPPFLAGRGDRRQAAISASSRCSAASSAAGAISTSSDVAQRALGEGREPAQRLDLDVEHVDPHRPLLGRREHVEQAPRAARTGRAPRPGRRARSRPPPARRRTRRGRAARRRAA